MKLLIKLILIWSLVFLSQIGNSQISDILPNWAFGDDPNNQDNVIHSWIGSGAPSLNAGLIYINNVIDVSDYEIYPGINGNTAYLINDLLKNQLPSGKTIVYFPPGVYYLEKGIKIYSNTIIKGNGGDADDPERTEFRFDYSDDLPLYKSVSISFSGTECSGLEDVYLFDQTDPLIGVEPNKRYEDLISISNTSSNIWIRGVESYLTRRFHVNIYGNKVTVSGCYFHDSWSYSTGGRGYGVCLSKDSYYCRVENNVFNHLRHAMVFQYNAKQNVVSYNFSRDVHAINNGFDYKASDLDFHGRHESDLTGPAWNLCEGNKVERIFFDDVHEQNGPYNVIFRCNGYSNIKELKVEKVQGSDHQFMQNVVGTNAEPYYSVWEQNFTKKWLTENGFVKYWEDSPNYLEIPSEDCSYYLYERPSFYDLNTSWLSWPYMPNDDDIIPAKYRYDRNHECYQNDPPQHEVVFAGWDLYIDICGPPKYILNESESLSEHSAEYVAMDYIEAGPLNLQNDNNIILKASNSIKLLPGFIVSSNDNYFHAIAGNPCSNDEEKALNNISAMSLTLLDLEPENNKMVHTNIGFNEDSNTNPDNIYYSGNSKYLIYPNPNKGRFSVEISKNIEENSFISVKDLMGCNIDFVKEIKDNVLTIDIKNNKPGSFIFSMKNKNMLIQEIIICQ